MIDNRIVGRTITALRQEKGMTQQQLAAVANVSHQAVSKWENGAALPDIQTLIKLSELFGVSIDQLLNGKIDGLNEDNKGTDEQTNPFKEISNSVKDVLGGMFRQNRDQQPHQEVQPDGIPDVERLIQTAPFMSREAIENMLNVCDARLNANQLARIAPFVSAECLEELILKNNIELNWKLLRKLAPFLKKEAVDRLAMAITYGERKLKPAAENIYKGVDELGKKINKAADKAAKKVRKYADTIADAASQKAEVSERTREVRKLVFGRALDEGKWDWLAQHMEELDDEALKARIAVKACAEGKHDWVFDNMRDYSDAEAAYAALERRNWVWLGEHIKGLSQEVQEKVASTAADEGNFDWLSENMRNMQLNNVAVELARKALDGGRSDLSIGLAGEFMTQEQVAEFAREAFDKGDYDLMEALMPYAGEGFTNWALISLATDKNWEMVKRYTSFADQETIAQLTEFAVAQGDWEAIDMISSYLK